MIVKNEAEIIAKCLNSVKPFIDYWIVCDNGSTDNTEQVVKETLKDIPGKFYHHQWHDFATNRNMALELAKSHGDYTLIIDADDCLYVANEDVFSNLTQLVYNISITLKNLTYPRPQLISNSIEYKYVGVLHEYLDLPAHAVAVPLPNCKIVCGSGVSARGKDPDKYLKDAQTLEKILEVEPDNARYVFYCAQSYRDAGNLELALKYYTLRTKMSGYLEETYISFLEIGKIKERLAGDFKDITAAYLSAYQCNPNRNESLVYLAMYYRNQDMLAGTYAYAKLATNISKPNDILFMEPECYNWKCYDELAVAGYWLGKYKEAAIINMQLLTGSSLPELERPRVLANLKFCEDHI
jgi:glycosyltransferase involved in cell wall biosynthesis